MRVMRAVFPDPRSIGSSRYTAWNSPRSRYALYVKNVKKAATKPKCNGPRYQARKKFLRIAASRTKYIAAAYPPTDRSRPNAIEGCGETTSVTAVMPVLRRSYLRNGVS